MPDLDNLAHVDTIELLAMYEQTLYDEEGN